MSFNLLVVVVVVVVVVVEVWLYLHRYRRFIRDGSPGRLPRLSHSSWALVQLLLFLILELVDVSGMIFSPQRRESSGLSITLNTSADLYVTIKISRKNPRGVATCFPCKLTVVTERAPRGYRGKPLKLVTQEHLVNFEENL